MDYFTKNFLAIGIGIPAIVWFSYCTSWQAGMALFLAMLANNISQIPPNARLERLAGNEDEETPT